MLGTRARLSRSPGLRRTFRQQVCELWQQASHLAAYCGSANVPAMVVVAAASEALASTVMLPSSECRYCRRRTVGQAGVRRRVRKCGHGDATGGGQF